MTAIELPDEQAAALTEKAAAQGLTLAELIQKLAVAAIKQTAPDQNGKPAELPVLNLSPITGSLRRCDIYDDVC